MKKILIQLGQWIVKYRKKLIYGALALGIFQICFFNFGGIGTENQVFAQNIEAKNQSQSQEVQKKMKELNTTLPFLNKVVYVLIYPMLVLAGKLADNSFVYGEVFGFDVVLWKLWNIVKNLANFTLALIVIYKIFKYLINGKEKVKDIILSALIAGIGIQASWFIMAALIDVSTILTYGVGGLPISALKGSKDDIEKKSDYNPYILKNVIDLDIKDSDTIHVYLTNTKIGDKQSGEFYISECETFVYGGSGGNTRIILSPKMIYYKNNTGDYMPTDSNRCHYYGQVYYFKNLYNDSNNDLRKFEGGGKFKEDSTRTGTQQAYEGVMNTSIGNIKNLTGDSMVNLISNGTLLEIGNAHVTGGVFGGIWTGVYPSGDMVGLDVHNEWTGTGGNTSKLQDILDGKSYVGVFTALYATLINSGEGIVTAEDSLAAQVLNSALSFGYVLAIGIPLIIVAVVFMIRVGVLWVAIAISPFIVLASAFKEIGDKIFKGDFLEYFSLKNLIPIIFSPAIICFAISMSSVLVSIIGTINEAEIGTEESPILGGLIQLDIAGLTLPIARLIISVFGVALTWFLVWAAIESSKIGESKIIKSIKDLTQTTLGSIPIVPVPGKDKQGMQFVGANTAFGLNGQQGVISQITNNIKSQYEGQSNEALQQWLDPEGAKEAAKTAQQKAQQEAQQEAEKKEIDMYAAGLSQLDVTNDWRNQSITIKEDGNDRIITFTGSRQPEQEKLIQAINNLTEDKRKEFGKVLSVPIGSKTRNFNPQTNKYVESSASSAQNQSNNSSQAT